MLRVTAPYQFSMSAGAGGEGGVWALPGERLGTGRGQSLPGELGIAGAPSWGKTSELPGATSEGLRGGAERSPLPPGSPFPEAGSPRGVWAGSPRGVWAVQTTPTESSS